MVGMFKLNFSDEDKASTPRGFDAVPAGQYQLAVTDIELAEVKNGPNAGNPYFKVEFTSQEEDGPSKNRKFWGNVMLFDLPSGNWFLAQFLKATGNGDALETGQVPGADAFMGKVVTAQISRVKDKYKNEQEPKPNGESWYRNDIKGFIVDDEDSVGTPTGRKKKSSLLP